MKIKEFEKYAQNNGFNSMRFEMVGVHGEAELGKWLDAYYGIFLLDSIGSSNFVRVSQIIEKFGYDYWDFTEIKENGK